MADRKTVQVTMVRGVVGENGTDWLPGEDHEASEGFALSLFRRGAAEPCSEKGDKKAAAKADKS